MALGARQKTRGRNAALLAYWIGRRVEIPPDTDRWMAGDRFGTAFDVRKGTNGEIQVSVRMDKSGSHVRFREDRLKEV